MAQSLPYLASPGSIKTALDRIRAAATPDRVTGDFVTTKLQIKGGTGAVIPSYLKKIGFVASDGTPTEIYKKFRNASTGGRAVAEAIKIGYAPLSSVNEYFYELNDGQLLDLIVQVTGAEKDSSSAKLTLSTLKTLKTFADFDAAEVKEETVSSELAKLNNGDTSASHFSQLNRGNVGGVGLNLSYTINLNLPATADQAVFNAIFRSLKEHLLKDESHEGA